MPFDQSWYIDRRVWHVRAYGTITVEDIAQANVIGEEAFASGSDNIHLLLDLRDVTHYPLKFTEFTKVEPIDTHDHLGWVLIVSGSTVTKFIASTLFQLIKMRVRTFNELEGAIAFLYEHDQSLTPVVKQE